MDNCFCTIITSDFLPYAKNLYKNFQEFGQAENFSVLVVNQEINQNTDFTIYTLSDLKTFSLKDFEKVKKYRTDLSRSFRWALKPLFLKFLLQEEGFDKVIYIDPDIHFYNNPDFLFNSLYGNDILITPHWRSKDPFKDKLNFEQLFTGGIFNAGFFGCNQNSINILDWWLKVCSYKMVMEDGFYVDQAFLNLMPIYFPGQVKIMEHKGCNVAGWNLTECKRVEKDGNVLINDKYPIIFIHFTPGTISEILSGHDPLLGPYLSKYERTLKKFKKEFSFKKKKLEKRPESKFLNFFKKITFKRNKL